MQRLFGCKFKEKNDRLQIFEELFSKKEENESKWNKMNQFEPVFRDLFLFYEQNAVPLPPWL